MGAYEYGKDDIKKGNDVLVTQVMDELDRRKSKSVIVKQETELDQIVNIIEKGTKVLQTPIISAILAKKFGIDLNGMTSEQETKMADEVAGVSSAISKAEERLKSGKDK